MTLDPRTLPETTVTLPDGRGLGYIECGDPTGKPVFCFDGWPSSRWGALLKDTEAQAVGVRLIGVDRPGMGLSDFAPDGTLLGWPADVAALADSLELDRWAVWGFRVGLLLPWLVLSRFLSEWRRVGSCRVPPRWS